MTTTGDEVWGGEIRRGLEGAAAIDSYKTRSLRALTFTQGKGGVRVRSVCRMPLGPRLTGKKVADALGNLVELISPSRIPSTFWNFIDSKFGSSETITRYAPTRGDPRGWTSLIIRSAARKRLFLSSDGDIILPTIKWTPARGGALID